MKLERMIGILAVLQTHGRVTCPFLAEKFEVSIRTICRDIDEISKAGIPLVTTRGNGGGVALMEGYALDTTLFTQAELTSILAGVRAVDSVSPGAKFGGVLAKIGGDVVLPLTDDMEIELSSFYKADLTEKIETICRAIGDKRVISFVYCYVKGECEKRLEPVKVVFRWSDWYVYGYSLERQDFRLYKLRRLWNLKIEEETFVYREIPAEPDRYGSHMTDHIPVTARCDAKMKYRFVEEFGYASVKADGKDTFVAHCYFSSYREAVMWFLGLGEGVTVLSPPELVEEMRNTLKKINENYQT